MASAEQVKALLKSYIERDEPRFFSTAMQIAASEARVGHGKLAQELRTLIDEARSRGGLPEPGVRPIPISRPTGELAGLLNVSYPSDRISHMTLGPDVLQQLNRLLKEQREANKLRGHGLSPRRRLLLVGPPGTGKTMTASVLAGELGIPLFVVRLDGLITKFMGESTAKLRLIFDAIEQTRGVYLFDEFDSIGTHRGFEHEVGEIRRVLNAFLMFLEADRSTGLIIAATNRPESLDQALYRRFDDVIEYSLPIPALIASFIRSRLAMFEVSDGDIARGTNAAMGLSYAEIGRACEEALKAMVLQDKNHVNINDIVGALKEKKSFLK